jgi:hypothetical protein
MGRIGDDAVLRLMRSLNFGGGTAVGYRPPDKLVSSSA